jgi:uncharacterized C2H2 Zn-finger protein
MIIEKVRYRNGQYYKSYQCSECNLRFRYKINVKNHMRKKHGIN